MKAGNFLLACAMFGYVLIICFTLKGIISVFEDRKTKLILKELIKEIHSKDSLYQKANGEIIRHNLKYNCIEK